ncbi:hypothetical protein EDC01DRAFT_647791, partial [Geopyxis carbonaria]
MRCLIPLFSLWPPTLLTKFPEPSHRESPDKTNRRSLFNIVGDGPMSSRWDVRRRAPSAELASNPMPQDLSEPYVALKYLKRPTLTCASILTVQLRCRGLWPPILLPWRDVSGREYCRFTVISVN